MFFFLFFFGFLFSFNSYSPPQSGAVRNRISNLNQLKDIRRKLSAAGSAAIGSSVERIFFFFFLFSVTGVLLYGSCPPSAVGNLPASAQFWPGTKPHRFCRCLFLQSSMSDYGGVSSNGVGGGVKKDAFADAVQRARQVSHKKRRKLASC